MILDCSSPESAKKSLCEMFGVAEEELLLVLGSINPHDSDFQPPQDVIYEQVCEQCGEPYFPLEITWFHGTRAEDPDSFYKHGILPKTVAGKILKPRLFDLSKGLEHSGENPYSASLIGKQGEHDEGPFAFLIKDVAIHAPSPHHNYVQAPEMVEDFAGELLGENWAQLVDRYKEVTRPYVISFVANSRGHDLPYALWYVKLVEDGWAQVKAAGAANTCFCGNGSVISPEQIRDVEEVLGA